MEERVVIIPRVKIHHQTSSLLVTNLQSSKSKSNSIITMEQQQDGEVSSSSSNKELPLIKPKKLVNPCKESSLRQELHRELMFNQKIGQSPLNKKTELQKALEKVKHGNKNVGVASAASPPPEFQKVLEERKRLIEDNHYFVDATNRIDPEGEGGKDDEFIQVHRKINNKGPPGGGVNNEVN